jgi:hypothetical protein
MARRRAAATGARVAIGGSLWLAAFVAASCGGAEGSVVFGVKSELDAGSDITSLAVRMEFDGEAILERTFTDDLAFPLELDSGALEAGGTLSVTLSAMQGERVLLTKSAITDVVDGKRSLYRLSLETDCVDVTCSESTTCTDGECVSATQSGSSLPDYFEGWVGGNATDRCKPGGAPEVVLGEGQADYHAVDEGQVLQVEQGPQGGYHVWVAARLKNLRQGGSITEVSGSFVDIDYDPAPFSIVFSFDPDEGDYCKIFGLRFRLDDEAHPIETLLGERLDLRIKITDSDGDSESDTVRVTLSDDFI